MRTRELIHAKIKSRLGEGEPMPLFTAKELALYEVIDEVKQIALSKRHKEDGA